MFRGEYKKNNFNGIRAKYFAKDTVIFQGNIYECLSPTSDSPIQNPQKWEYNGNYILYVGETPPISPQVGQQWEKNGAVYTYFYDGNNYSWVQL